MWRCQTRLAGVFLMGMGLAHAQSAPRIRTVSGGVEVNVVDGADLVVTDSPGANSVSIFGLASGIEANRGDIAAFSSRTDEAISSVSSLIIATDEDTQRVISSLNTSLVEGLQHAAIDMASIAANISFQTEQTENQTWNAIDVLTAALNSTRVPGKPLQVQMEATPTEVLVTLPSIATVESSEVEFEVTNATGFYSSRCISTASRYDGDYVATPKKVSSIDDCIDLCADTEGCAFFSFNKQGSVCYRSNVSAVLTYTSGFMSGPVVATPDCGGRCAASENLLLFQLPQANHEHSSTIGVQYLTDNITVQRDDNGYFHSSGDGNLRRDAPPMMWVAPLCTKRIDRIVVYNRGNCCEGRLNNARAQVRSAITGAWRTCGAFRNIGRGRATTVSCAAISEPSDMIRVIQTTGEKILQAIEFQAFAHRSQPQYTAVTQRVSVSVENSGEESIANIPDLQPGNEYAIRYRGVNPYGAGPWSKYQIAQTPEVPVADLFECIPAANCICGTGGRSMCTCCEVNVTVTHDSIFYAAFTGNYKSAGSWAYAGISYDNDFNNIGTNNYQNMAPSHGYSTQYEQFHSARSSRTLSPGTHSVKLLLRCPSTRRCELNGLGLQGMAIRKTAGVMSSNCRYGSWSWRMGTNRRMCDLNFRTVAEKSIVMATFTGHVRVNSGAVYGVVDIDGDGYNQYNRQWNNPAHTYSNSWENFGSARVKVINEGSHRASVLSGPHGAAWLNGGGISHVTFPAEPEHWRSQRFSCVTERGWSGARTGSFPTVQCVTTFNTPVTAVMMAEFTGHYYVSGGGGCVGAISIDGDVERWANNTNGLQAPWGTYAAVMGSSTRWENFQSKRFAKVGPGSHTVSVVLRTERPNSRCYLNGMGMDGVWVRSATVDL